MNAGKSIGALFAGLLFVGCAASQTVQLQSTPPLKGKGTLKVTKLDERNTKVELRAEQLELPGASYVVWAVPFGDLPAVKVGRLGADQHLKATIGLTDFWIIMTAEHSAEVQEP